jgi:hypothetical protein
MKMRVFATALLALLLVSPASAMGSDEVRAWQDDLRLMAKEMERTHKNLYHTTSREKFAAMVAALNAKIPSLQRHEVIVEMAKIVAAVGDGHTNIYPTRDPKIGFHTLPVTFTSATSYTFGRLTIRNARSSARKYCALATATLAMHTPR